MVTGTRERIGFHSEVASLEEVVLLRVPPEASRLLPSRGQVAVTATVAGLAVGDAVELSLEVQDTWPEPELPDDPAAALDGAPADIQDTWLDITPMARREWVRWVCATRNPDTRQRRVEVTISKMEHGKRRPCCFDLSSCTDPDVARSGKLPLG